MRQESIYCDRVTAIHCNSGNAVSSSGWARQANGVWKLERNKSASTMVIDVPVNKNDVIIGFRIMGGMGAKAGGTSTLDADLRRVIKAAGSVTDASVGAITQVSKVADYTIDESKTITSPHVVADDYHYYVLVTGTTADNGANDIFITGVEVDVKKKWGDSQASN